MKAFSSPERVFSSPQNSLKAFTQVVLRRPKGPDKANGPHSLTKGPVKANGSHRDKANGSLQRP